jgi:hypothetical protein
MTYYIRYDDTFLILNSHSDVNVTYPARTTSHPTADRKNKSDNYITDPPTAQFSGIVSDVFTSTSQNPLGAGGYIDKIKSIMEAGYPVKLKHRLDGEEESNWFITNFTPSQSNANGWGATKADGTIVQSFQISITLQQVIYAEGITEGVSVPKAYSDALAEKEEKKAVSTSFEDKSVSSVSKKEEAIKTANESFEKSNYHFKKASELENDEVP